MMCLLAALLSTHYDLADAPTLEEGRLLQETAQLFLDGTHMWGQIRQYISPTQVYIRTTDDNKGSTFCGNINSLPAPNSSKSRGLIG